MIELKVQCDCGQKYKFDVDPANRQMPFRVNCPVCGLDGTAKANVLLQAMSPAPAPAAAPPLPPPVPSQTRLAIAAAVPAPPLPAQMPQRYPSSAGVPLTALGAGVSKKSAGTNNLLLGILGAILGAAVGGGLMYGFFIVTSWRFPLFGTALGALTGLGARILYRGTDSALGAISGGIAAAAVVGTLYLMYHEFPLPSLLTAGFGVYFAYRIAA